MKRMAKLKPEMEKLKEKYADDPNKLNTETMGLYRKFGINPLGGCLPMFIQIPIFYGFFSSCATPSSCAVTVSSGFQTFRNRIRFIRSICHLVYLS